MKSFDSVLVGMNYCIMLCLRVFVGTRFNCHVPKINSAGRPIIVVANHQSMYDIPFFIWELKKNSPRFIAKKELSHGIPSISYALRNMGSAIIDRKDRVQALVEIKKLAKEAKENNWCICIFPEGTRARDGVLKQFKTAGFSSLLQELPDALVVPAVIDGSWKILRYNFKPIPYGTNIGFKLLAPIETYGKDAKGIIQEIEGVIRSNLDN